MEPTTRNYAIQSPREIFTNFSGKEENRVTLAVECHMNPAKIEDELSPQTLFGKFTRLVFSMIRSGSSVRANINFDELPDIVERTAYARAKVYDCELNPAGQADNASGGALPIAYTTTFGMGPFKGRTPADVVMEDPEGNREKLGEHYKLLQANVEKYPRNKIIMDAITNAYDLYKEGKLEKKTAKPASGRTFEIYKSGYRPLTREKREDGMCKVKEMTVQCNIGNRYPIEIAISEYYAPVTSVNGRLNVQAGATDQTSKKTVVAYMSMKDWNCLLSKVNDQKLMFIAANGPSLIAEADRLQMAKFQKEAV